MGAKVKIVLTVAATVVSAVASVLKILEWFGLTRSNLGVWPRWIQLALTGLIFAVAIAGAAYLWRKWTEKRTASRKKERAVFAIAVLLKKFSGWASQLRDELETIRHACEDNGIKFAFPLTTSLDVIPEHIPELRRQITEFRFRLFYYQELFESVFPGASYALEDCDRNLTCEYIRLKRMFDKHLDELKTSSAWMREEYVTD